MSLDKATGAVLDEQRAHPPIPSPSPPPSPVGRSLFFSGSPSPLEPEVDPDNGLPMGPSPSSSGDGSGSAGEWPSDHDESPGETGPPASSGDEGGPLKPLSKAALKATSRKGVLVATGALHRIAARHELERQAGLYIADEQDQELIGDPIAELLHRRGGIVGGKMSQDANDALSALMGVANYIGKQMALTMELSQLKASGYVHGGDADGEVA